jgi:hypothetical protein
MPGYAYPVGVSESDIGTAKSVTVKVTDVAPAYTTIFTATQKTKVTSILLSNAYGTILPVNLYVYRAVSSSNFSVLSTRVLKTKYALQSLVSGDVRVGDDTNPQSDLNKMLTELVLQVGDVLKANCPIEDEVSVTVNVTEGVS